jgi:hypothetical protein
MQMIAKEREAKLDSYTLTELKDTTATTYKAVGKGFVFVASKAKGLGLFSWMPKF